MSKLTSFYYYHNSKASTLDAILQEGSMGIDSSFIQKNISEIKREGE